MKCAEVLSARTSSTAVHLPVLSERPLDTPTIPYIYIYWLWKDKLNYLTSPKPRLQVVQDRSIKTAIWAHGHVIIYTMDIGISCAASPRIITAMHYTSLSTRYLQSISTTLFSF